MAAANKAAAKVAAANKAVPAKKAPAKKAPARKAPAKAAAAKTAAAKVPAASATRPTTSDLSAADLTEIRAQLQTESSQMRAEYEQSISDLTNLQQSHTDGAGDDQADVGAKTFDREQEQSIAANRLYLLNQMEHAIERIDAGTYGRCENCGRPIPKARLKALPMATLDAGCKAREERH